MSDHLMISEAMISGSLTPGLPYPNDPLAKIIMIENLVLLDTADGEKIGKHRVEYDGWDLDEAVALLIGFAPPAGDPFLTIAARYKDLHSIMADALRLAEMIRKAQANQCLPTLPSPAEYLEWLSGKRFPGDQPYCPSTVLKSYAPLSSELQILTEEVQTLESIRLSLEAEIAKERAAHHATQLIVEELKATIKVQKLTSVKTLKRYLRGLVQLVYISSPEKERPNSVSAQITDAWDKLAELGIEGDSATFRRYVIDGELEPAGAVQTKS